MRQKFQHPEDENKLKMYIYSAHDTNLLALISAMKLLDVVQRQPPYTSIIFLELRKNGRVDILYKNSTGNHAIRTEQPTLLPINFVA